MGGMQRASEQIFRRLNETDIAAGLPSSRRRFAAEKIADRPLPKNLRQGIASRRGHVAPALLLC